MPRPGLSNAASTGTRAAVYVHTGGCPMAGKRSKAAPRDQALHALADGVPVCPHCRPDSGLGYLDG
ncbi:DUF6233 domain-containing protein [Streptomyces sp. Tue6028]|uniref:DUF6233 domain-containing protein n=1 Tax=Streptomyces sp. Tue6028 TaxID=2036037 RepID=UPI003D721D39